MHPSSGCLRHVHAVLRQWQAENPELSVDVRQRDAGHLPLPAAEVVRGLHHRLHRADGVAAVQHGRVGKDSVADKLLRLPGIYVVSYAVNWKLFFENNGFFFKYWTFEHLLTLILYGFRMPKKKFSFAFRYDYSLLLQIILQLDENETKTAIYSKIVSFTNLGILDK